MPLRPTHPTALRPTPPNAIPRIGAPSDGVFVAPTRIDEIERPVTPGVEFDAEYKVKQYGTNFLLSGGAIAAGVFIFAPEPIVTKIIGGSIALSCIAAGGLGKHYMYRNAYVHRALEKALIKLNGQIDTLGTEISILEATSKSLENTNQGLQRTKGALEKQGRALKRQIDRLDIEVAEAFEQLNSDRRAFEDERATKISQLNDEISEADARGDRAQIKLEELDIREASLSALSDELTARRKKLATSEAEVRAMQSQLLGLLAENPDAVPTRTSVGTSTNTEIDPTLFSNLKTFATLHTHPGAKLRVNTKGEFEIQDAGFFSQSVPRTFEAELSVTSRSKFFRPVFKFFHRAKNQFQTSELQQAFNGLCTMRTTYASNRFKSRILNELIQVVQADNSALAIPAY